MTELEKFREILEKFLTEQIAKKDEKTKKKQDKPIRINRDENDSISC